jgi:DHA1 family multidrug resistance protein-like MFS transporter
MVYGLSYSASFSGMFLGPLLGGFLAARFGFASVFVTTSCLLLLNLVWVFLGVRSTDPKREWA